MSIAFYSPPDYAFLFLFMINVAVPNSSALGKHFVSLGFTTFGIQTSTMLFQYAVCYHPLVSGDDKV